MISLLVSVFFSALRVNLPRAEKNANSIESNSECMAMFESRKKTVFLVHYGKLNDFVTARVAVAFALFTCKCISQVVERQELREHLIMSNKLSSFAAHAHDLLNYSQAANRVSQRKYS